jgi:hypothetical protein
VAVPCVSTAVTVPDMEAGGATGVGVFCISSGAACAVVYLHLTDKSRAGDCGKMVSFQHRERGHHRGTEPVVVPTPTRYSRVALPHDSCLVARPSQGRTSQDLQAG